VQTLKTVGIRKLKNSLSAYIREAKAGAVILVTDRGDIVAELRSPGKDYSQLSRERLKQEWIDSDKLLLPIDAKKPLGKSPVSLQAGTSEKILDDDRKDSR
jgi:antitoxin (DNA-binding transcriptional repressor) of toxin-antitoxin stability system